MDERACNRHTLHLPAGKLVGIAIAESFKFHPGKPLPCRLARIWLPGEEQRQLHVLEYRQRVQQLKRLKNEADPLATQLRQAAIFQRRRRNSVQKHLARSRKIHCTCQIEQRGLSAAAASYKRHKFATLNIQGNIAERGEFVALVGRSGCGKSTLLNLAGAMDFPTSGEVLIDGRSTSKLSERELTALRRKHIGFVFQFFQLLPTLTALENVELPLLLAGEPNTAPPALDRL